MFNPTGISLKNSLAASLLAQMVLPPSSCSSPFAVPSVCHLLFHFSDLFMKYVCTTPFAMAAEECWNCDQTYFLFPFVQFVSSNPLGSVGVSGLVLNDTSVVSNRGCAENFLVVARQGTAQTSEVGICLSPGRRWSRVWVAALACQSSTLTKRNFISEALDRGFIVPQLPGMKGRIEALSPIQVLPPHLSRAAAASAPALCFSPFSCARIKARICCSWSQTRPGSKLWKHWDGCWHTWDEIQLGWASFWRILEWFGLEGP